jgi:branched-subunit amino acid transport protein
MTDAQIWVAILIAAGVSLLVRALPLTLIRRPIKNRFIRSFLYYVPYVTLAVMTFPAMIDAAVTPGAGIAALAAGVIAAGAGAGLFPVAVLCCAVEYVAGLL